MIYLLIYFSGYIAAYLLTKYSEVIEGEWWTVGKRVSALMWALSSWILVACYGIYLLVHDIDMDKSAKW